MIPVEEIRMTYNLAQQLAENTDKLIVYKLAALQRRIFQSLDLLLDDNLESSCANEQRRCGALSVTLSVPSFTDLYINVNLPRSCIELFGCLHP